MEEANNKIENLKIRVLESIRRAGFGNTTISEKNGGLYEGTFEELTKLEVPTSETTTTLEELEERPIVIEQTTETDET